MTNEKKKARRMKIVQLLGGVCVKCGTTKNLECDHKDPRTKTVRYLWSLGDARLHAEIPLLQLLCAKHHHEKSKAEWEIFHKDKWKNNPKLQLTQYKKLPLIHGTHTGRYHYKCKCLPCTTAYNDYDRSQTRGDVEYVNAAKKRLAALRAGGKPEDHPLPIPKYPGRAIWKKNMGF